MNHIKITYNKQFNNFILNYNDINLKLSFFELRILKQNLELLKPLTKIKGRISFECYNIIIKLTSNQFLSLYYSIKQFYKCFVDDYKIFINSKLVYK